MNTPIGTSIGSIERHRRAARLPLMVDTLINQRDEKIAACKLLLPQHATCMTQPQTFIKVRFGRDVVCGDERLITCNAYAFTAERWFCFSLRTSQSDSQHGRRSAIDSSPHCRGEMPQRSAASSNFSAPRSRVRK